VVALLLTAGLGAAGIWAVATSLGVLPAPDHIRVGAVLGVLVAGLAVVAVVRAIRRFTAPVDALIDAAGRIEQGDFAARVPEHGPREVRHLGRAFNAMSERLEANERQRRRFLADVAHELRTPLTVIQGRIEGVMDGVYPADGAHLQPALDEVRALERLVDDLRTLSLAETGTLTLVREPVDPALLVNDVVAAFAPAAADAGVDLRADLPAHLPSIEVDPGRIRQVLGNLVSNALGHAPSGGSVTVAATDAGDRVVLVVRDTGAGIAGNLLPRLFERFVKGEGSRGTGLGLAIARDLVVAHGGTIEAQSPDPATGRGTAITVRVPAGAAESGGSARRPT
jgi:signal transduction histidine kinase